ncbi:MAG TPA: hypothetical protein VGJ19_12805 [Streptosporangiaceae bacterium]|jgi:hypothetical protein
MIHSSPARTRLAASPVNTILAEMQGRTVTQGWDVVCAISCDKINEWFLQQYVGRLSNGETAVINGTAPQLGGVSLHAVNLTLGPPLISFSPNLPPGTVGLTINFLSGLVNVTQINNGFPTVLSSQVITPGDAYQLTGYVPLASVQGEVENGHDVVIDISNGTSFAAHLDMPEGAETLLGQFMQDWLVKNLNGYQYKLGTLDYSGNGTNLVPAGTFQFATQLDETDPTDTGRLLLFIPTTYNPGGGAQTALGLADIVPQGCSTALIISSRALFQGILKSFYESTFSNFGVQAEATQTGPDGPYKTTLTAGSVNVGNQSYGFSYAGGSATVFSGQDALGDGETPQPVVVSVTGTQLQVSNNALVISGRLQWPQNLAIDASIPRSEGLHEWATVTMTATIDGQMTVSVTPIKDTVSLNGTPSISVSFDESQLDNNGDPSLDGSWQTLAGQIAAAAQGGLGAFFDFPLPAINAFAVSNLLFPGQNILDFQSVYIPGDIVLFGDVATPEVVVSPGSATLGPGQTQQFSAATSSAEAVQWSVTPGGGTISSSGLYTAPAEVGQIETVMVKAMSPQSGGAAAAMVTLVPDGAQISPAFVTMQPTTPAQQFSAAVAGAAKQTVTWSMAGSPGTLSADGLYTPPASVPGPQAVTITATSTSDPSISGTALVVLVPCIPLLAVSPAEPSAPLAPGQTQQFQGTMPGSPPNQSVKWSLLPAVGNITPGGLYIAPETVTAPQAVLVVATSATYPTLPLYGAGLVMLAPGD